MVVGLREGAGIAQWDGVIAANAETSETDGISIGFGD
jgi:hypothetical protein